MDDDPDWLLRHIRHSFITSDDTGMCEMVIQDNDLLTLEEHRKRLQGQTFSPDRTDGSDFEVHFHKSSPPSQHGKCLHFSSPSPPKPTNVSLAPSPDISSGWDFGIRRRSNTAQKLERIRKERQSRVKVKNIHWKQMPEKYVSEHLDSMFEKKDKWKRKTSDESEELKHNAGHCDVTDGLVGKSSAFDDLNANLTKVSRQQLGISDDFDLPVQKKIVASHKGFKINKHKLSTTTSKGKSGQAAGAKSVSALSKQLAQSVHLAHNPFKDYSKFDGHGHEGSAITQRINIFVYVYGEPPPVYPLTVVVLVAGARISDLIGLACWKYLQENAGPKLKRCDVQGYSIYICEDDGEVDYGFPALDSYEPVSKFSFPTLALVEKHQVGDGTEEDGKFCESVFVKVNDYAGFSLIQVDDLSVKMGEVLKKAIKRRKGNKYVGVYRLEYQNKPGEVVDEDQTLDSTGVMEFCMVREHSARSKHLIQEKSNQTSASGSDVKYSATSSRSTTVQFLTLMSSS
ncbi:unnamed protein product [Clavelina lepadiformis]|uniref:Stress-activated map kinase-interacting protein 1 n=1 Tax=Clavelina lepadiformis TaxID=159417 RepID=A0ABP0EWU2_CLALP